MQQEQIGFCPSFSCYSSDSLASTAAARVSNELQQEDDFEFSILSRDKDFISSGDQTCFPVFNSEYENVCSDSLEKLFINDPEDNDNDEICSSSDESVGEVSRRFCLWGPHKMDPGTSTHLSKCKKSGSTGSGSKRWRIKDLLLRRSNSEGKEPVMLLEHNKKVDDIMVPKQKRRLSGDVSKAVGKLKPSVHEVFYVQQRARRGDGKRRSYLPYRQELVGLFSNVNGSGMILPF